MPGEVTAPRAVLVTGFGNSGVTAVMDLLAECDGFHCPPQEFYLVKHPDGIMALEDALVHSWGEFTADYALRRFESLVRVLGRPATRFRFGQDYDRHFCPDFTDRTLAYSRALASVRYDGHLMFRRAEMNRAEYFAYLVGRRFDVGVLNRHFARRYDTAFVPDPSRFASETRALMSDLLRSMARKSGASDVALCVGASPYQVKRSESYFEDASTIIVDRDPRDIYLSARASSYMPHALDAFIAWFRSTRENSAIVREGRDVALHVMFEDLVTRPDETNARVFNFLGLDPARHAKRGTRLVPERSARRIAKWKAYDRPEEIRTIERELERYLWTGTQSLPTEHRPTA